MAKRSIRREFVGWDGPCLPRAVAFLRQQHLRDGVLDLSGLLLVVPGKRAGRRLQELLAEISDAQLVPPAAVITTGELPEYLYRPTAPRCDELQSLLLRTEALRQMDRQTLAVALPNLPQPDDWLGFFNLAEELAELDDTLEAQLLSAADVPVRAAALADFPDEERWAVLAEAQRQYEALLQDAGQVDLHRARRAALRDGAVACPHNIVLISVLDLSGVTRAMLGALTSPVTALVHAPATEADGYDDLGTINTQAWMQRPVALQPRQVRIVDQPSDQCHEALRVLGEVSTPQRKLAVDQITVGLGDETMAAMVQRTLELADVPARQPAGISAAQSAPALLLNALANWIERRRPLDLAQLIRHPDVEDWLAQRLPRQSDDKPWCTVLDEYISQRVPAKLDGQWLGDEQSLPLQRITRQLQTLWPNHAMRPAPLPTWSEPIAAMLQAVYHRPLRRQGADEPTINALQLLGQLLGEHAELDEAHAATPALTLPAAMRLLLSRLGPQRLTPEPSGAAVELLGWLELQLDDAPTLIVLGMNDGLVPHSLTADAFLPDSLRQLLKLPDNLWRYARDRAALEAILHSRPKVTLIAGRRGHDGDPLLPSRLLLAAQAEELPQRVLAFCAEQSHTAAPLRLLACGNQSQLLIPPPQMQRAPLQTLRVTAFRDYLACPYRFYLKHVLKLESSDDRAVELDPLAFGNVAHEVLKAFGRDPIAACEKADKVADWFNDALDARVLELFGRQPRATILLQREVLRRRLQVLAQWQAAQTQQGWRILPDYVETEVLGQLELHDGQRPITVTGRIDRVDHHPQLGYRILDYKTGDSGQTPQQQHCRGREDCLEWVDLQLPLYHHLAPQMKIVGPVQLGYVLVCKDAGKIGLSAAAWGAGQLASAIEVACKVARNIRQQVFWPPADPIFDDALSAICMDSQMNRREVIQRVTALLQGRAVR